MEVPLQRHGFNCWLGFGRYRFPKQGVQLGLAVVLLVVLFVVLLVYQELLHHMAQLGFEQSWVFWQLSWAQLGRATSNSTSSSRYWVDCVIIATALVLDEVHEGRC